MILSNIDCSHSITYITYIYTKTFIEKANSSLEHQLTNTTSATESRKDYLVSCVYPAQETRQLGSDTSFV